MYSTPELYEKVLIEPARTGSNVLRIISGYATHTMASHHIEKIINNKIRLKRIELYVGMVAIDGISLVAHNGFIELCKGIKGIEFSCSYITQTPPIHSKAYCWLKDNDPVASFVGSCNYTQNAFIRGQREICTQADPNAVNAYIESLIGESLLCHHQDAVRYSEIYQSRHSIQIPEEEFEIHQQDEEYYKLDERYRGLETAEIQLIERRGTVPERSGLNWGQRDKRNRNQAYLSIRGGVRKTDFFPDTGEHFTVLTDDGASLVCSIAQQGRKAIHTPHDNSKLGEYFRRRLQLPDGEFVTRAHLDAYGRHAVKFYKIDEENYYMDFSNK